MTFDAITISQILLLLFLAIVFLQSGIDKIVDWKGNLGWLKSHFSKTFFAGQVPLLLFSILILECVSGALAAIGVVMIVLGKVSTIPLYAASLSAVSLLCLLLGQRLAKDYEGAKTIVIYLMPTLFLLYLLQ
ncbi:MAG: DoxX family protein [Bacteroidota bacterium]